ncbi:hypothetical protein [Massilia consociata]|uniref:Uncharacterized protein n=1 Tax=Massilia consociata TaxID=760117 RepID=A0ABV6FIX1_9BURK
MTFAEANSVTTIIERVASTIIRGLKCWKARPVTSVSQRFIVLFEAHGVRRNQIPRVLGHDLALSDLVDDASLLAKLTEPVLESACSLFGVRREWLDGEGEEPYARHVFYKYPADFQQFIKGLKAARPNAELTGYLVVPEKGVPGDQAFLILAEAVAASGDVPIYRYHVCDTWIFDYWKSRAYLTACVAIAWKNDVYVTGRYANKRELSILAGRGSLPAPVLERLASRGRRWYAEDLALRPDLYLRGLDAESNGFGAASALRLWLELDNEGWMDIGIAGNARSAFEAELGTCRAIE